MASHIPAWKRLGLKLKHANDSPSKQQQSAEGATASEHVESEVVPGIKRKLAPDSVPLVNSTPPEKRVRLTNGNTSLKKSRDIEISSPSKQTQSRRKKSVTFTLDTADEDGNSAQNISDPPSDIPGTTTPPKSRQKDKKSKAERRKLSATPSLQKPHAAVEYLLQYLNDQNSWKFNKNREIWILKHALSTQDIPTETNKALAYYIHGLKSAGARDRLKRACIEAGTTSTSAIDSKNEDQNNLRERFKMNLEHENGSKDATKDLDAWVEAQLRADLILMALGESAPASDISKGHMKRGGIAPRSSFESGANKPRVKKSKARTSRIDIESDTSSDDSTSESDTSSDSSSSSSSSE